MERFDFLPFGPTPQDIDYSPWTSQIPGYRCPSDPGTGLPALGRTNYAACLGDSGRNTVWFGNLTSVLISDQARNIQSRDAHRGVFVIHKDMKLRDILDGTSNTIAMGEIATDLGDNDKRTFAPRSAFAYNPYNQPGLLPAVCGRPTSSVLGPELCG